MHKHDLPDEAKEGLQAVRDNSHGMVTIIGLVVWVAIGLVVRNDLLFGLVMGTVFISGLGAGRKISEQLADQEMQAGTLMPAKIIAAIVTGIVVAIIIALIRGFIGESINPMEGDNAIIQIVKHFFDMWASVAVATGVLVGAFTHGMRSE